MTKRKRIFIICGFCALLVVAGVLNFIVNKNVTENIGGETIVTTATFFEKYESDRLTTNAQDKLLLEAIINNENTSAEAKANAEAELLSMAKYSKLENTIEGMIKAKNFSNVVVSAQENYISVIVQSAELTENQVAQIVEIIQSSSDYGIENIKIIPVE